MYRLILLLLSVAIVGIAFVVSIQQDRSQISANPTNLYRPLEELLAVHKQMGWSVVNAPDDGLAYRFCGAIGDNDPDSDCEWIEGSFQVGERTVSFRVWRPDHHEIEVNGLCPAGEGDLRYVVLTRPWPDNASGPENGE